MFYYSSNKRGNKYDFQLNGFEANNKNNLNYNHKFSNKENKSNEIKIGEFKNFKDDIIENRLESNNAKNDDRSNNYTKDINDVVAQAENNEIKDSSNNNNITQLHTSMDIQNFIMNMNDMENENYNNNYMDYEI